MTPWLPWEQGDISFSINSLGQFPSVAKLLTMTGLSSTCVVACNNCLKSRVHPESIFYCMCYLLGSLHFSYLQNVVYIYIMVIILFLPVCVLMDQYVSSHLMGGAFAACLEG